jgi:hypothetical protein
LLAPAVGGAATDGDGKVTVEGGPDESGHTYEFTVTNNHDSPIVMVEFPHFRADIFAPPPGWSTEGTTNAMGHGNINAKGVCMATASLEVGGVPPRGKALFSIRVRPKGAWRGSDTVTVTFADGTVAKVPGVPLPQPEPAAAKGTRLIGFAVLGVLFLIAVAARRKKQQSAAGELADAGSSPTS